ncbi:hypothetical protein FKM82_028106 [Ascaphus truei]
MNYFTDNRSQNTNKKNLAVLILCTHCLYELTMLGRPPTTYYSLSPTHNHRSRLYNEASGADFTMKPVTSIKPIRSSIYNPTTKIQTKKDGVQCQPDYTKPPTVSITNRQPDILATSPT